MENSALLLLLASMEEDPIKRRRMERQATWPHAILAIVLLTLVVADLFFDFPFLNN